ncbi:MAG: hypothetical protein ACFFC7_13520, partial [Candidatus Hermodarchaeota archaeon]
HCHRTAEFTMASTIPWTFFPFTLFPRSVGERMVDKSFYSSKRVYQGYAMHLPPEGSRLLARLVKFFHQ